MRPAAASLPSIERATTRGCRRAISESTSSAAASAAWVRKRLTHKPTGGQPVLLCLGKAGIDGVDHVAQAAVPRRPVRRVDDHVGIAGTAVGQAPAVVVAQRGQALARAGQAAGPIQKVQKVRQAFELQQPIARPGHGHAGLRCPLRQHGRLEAAFEVRMHLGLGQGAESVEGRFGAHGATTSRLGK